MNRELLKGTTDIMVLRILKEEPMYGYGMIKKFAILSNGIFEFKEGTLYPILHSLEKKGYIESFWQDMHVGRKRKYYKITQNGLAMLSEKEKEWRVFSKTVNEILSCDYR